MPGMFDTEGLTIEGMVFDGDIPPSDIPWFVEGGRRGSASDLADSIAFVISRPEGFCVNELVVRPTRQLNPVNHARPVRASDGVLQRSAVCGRADDRAA